MTIAWIAVGVVLIAVELHHMAFYALFAALGCFAAAAVSSVAPGAVAAQVATAVVVAAAGIVLIRGRVSAAFAHRHEGEHVPGVHGGLIGQEVLTLDLRSVDWVVLSACQSGVGTAWPLEGSSGMRRAFRLAGARGVIASQWSIADESTREWMRALYTERAGFARMAEESRSIAAAMSAADRRVLGAQRKEHRTTHPFYWAAFTATGR